MERRAAATLALLLGLSLLALCAAPVTAQPDFPRCNRVDPTDRRLVAQGEALFHDPRIFHQRGPFPACADCHPAANAFTDNRNHQVAPALSHRGRPRPDPSATFPRQTPSLLQHAGQTAPYTWDGRAACLQEATFGAITSPLEMGGHLSLGQKGQAQLDAIAAYLLSLRPPPPLTDRDPAKVARGAAIFNRPTACVRCHTGPELTDNRLHDHGIGDGDPGAGLVGTGPLGAFNTPPLRGIRLSAPYFHNGRNGLPAGSAIPVATDPEGALRQVVEFYNSHFNLQLSDRDMRDLVDFLLSR